MSLPPWASVIAAALVVPVVALLLTTGLPTIASQDPPEAPPVPKPENRTQAQRETAFRGQTAGAGAPAQGEPTGALYDVVPRRDAPADESHAVTWDFGEGGMPSYTDDYTTAEPREAGSGRPIEVEGDIYLRVHFFPARRALFTEDEAIETYEGPLRFELEGHPNLKELVFLGDFEAEMTWYVGMDRMAGFDVDTMIEDTARFQLTLYDPVPGISHLPVLTVGSTGVAVANLKRMLVEEGYLDDAGGPLEFDETLRRAVVAFQEDNGIIPNGRVGPETWAELVEFDFSTFLPGLTMQGAATAPPTASATPTATPSPDPTATPGEPSAGTIFLTFDDGPSARWTPQVLDLLEKYDAEATFFVVGGRVSRHPSIAQRVISDGHAIGNHTFNHQDLTGIRLDKFFAEVRSTQETITETTGVSTNCLRPPYGATSNTVRDRAADLGLTTVLWDIDPQDWARPGASAIANHVINNANAGAVVLLHDGGGNRAQTVEALEMILPSLRARGFEFAPLDC